MRRRANVLGIVLLTICMGPATGCKKGSNDALQEPHLATAADSVDAAESAVLPVNTDDKRSVAQRLHDVSIATNVRLKLADQDGVDISKIALEVDNGRVVLAGDVPSEDVRARAVSAAKSVDGVRQVVNQLNAPNAPPPAPPKATSQPQQAPETQAPQQQTPASETPKTTPTPEPQKPETKYYTVRSGDNLWTIARKNGITVAQLKQLNNISGNKIRPGQKLRVK